MIEDATFAVVTAPKRSSRHWKAGEVTWGELLDWVKHPAHRKEAGNYLLGRLRATEVQHTDKDGKPEGDPCLNLHRRKNAIESRSALTLDIDTPTDDFRDRIELLFPHAALIHTTFSSTKRAPRYRMIVPVDREMTPDEYVEAATVLMERLGVESFDPGSVQAERYMFKPATSDDDHYWWAELEGDPIAVDDLLADFTEDLSELPAPRVGRNKRDPFELEGVVGAFNRAYEDLDELIEAYDLPYDKQGDDRYQLTGSRAMAGMGPVQGTHGLFYSHHANDPAFGQTCTAFDLVRLHRFGELDEDAAKGTPINRLPSFLAMSELATLDHRVIAEVVGADFTAELGDEADAQDWRLGLSYDRKLKPKDTHSNWDILLSNDPAFTPLYYNELTESIEIDRDLPWRSLDGGAVWVDSDTKQLRLYLERSFNGFLVTASRLEDWITEAAMRRRLNPIRDYLEGLQWDGKARVETSLPGVRPTRYTRMVARKCLAAAVARVFEPGIKWDHTLVLYGDEGIGKSWWVGKLARGWMGQLGPIGHKDTLLKLQRSWIVLADEGHSLRKGENDALKEFLTRTEDLVRQPYGKATVSVKRHCVIWTTTNDETFLRRQKGNRRFLIVHSEHKVDFSSLTDDYVDQLWAEAVHIYRSGEPLFLSDAESELAASQREAYVEEDTLAGLIDTYVNTGYPDDWEQRQPEARQAWLADYRDGFEAEGDYRVSEVSTIQLWVEALGRKRGDHTRTALLEIGEALSRMGWTILDKPKRTKAYGVQRVYVRPARTVADELEELL